MNAQLMKVTQACKAVECKQAISECISILVQGRMVGGLSRPAKLEVIIGIIKKCCSVKPLWGSL